MEHDAFFVISAWVFAVAATGFAVWQAMSRSNRQEKIGLAALMVGAVVICFLLGL
jgi:hypothetical protein